jgi:predicted PurR-regulated permease PerM
MPVLLWRLTVGQFADLSERLRQGLDRTVTYLANVLPLGEGQIDRTLADLQVRIQQLSPDPLSGALTVLEIVAAVLLALFVAFFLVKDGPAMRAWLLRELPSSAASSVGEAVSAAWAMITGYVRGILIVAAIDAVGIGVALAIIGVPLALPLALLVFVGGLIPYIGAAATGAVAVLVALAANGPTDALLTLVAVIVVQQLEGNLLEPLVVGRQVRLHPVAVVVVVFAGSLLAGVAGAIVAVPVAAVAYRIYRVRRDLPVIPHPAAHAAG